MKFFKIRNLVLVALLVGCSSEKDSDPPITTLIYESKNRIQCEGLGFTLSESREKLILKGIDVIESNCGEITGLAYLTVCGADTPDILIHKIFSSNLPHAEEVGFNGVSTIIDIGQGVDYQVTDCSDKFNSELLLQQNNWNLISYGFQTNEKTDVLANTSYSLHFNSTSQVSGSIDCNTFVSGYESDEDSLSIQTVALTEIACLLAGNQDYQAQTSFILNALIMAQTYNIVNLVLTITSNDSSQLIFTAVNE